jgi:hypothetical protein
MKRGSLVLVAMVIAALLAAASRIRPSNDRDWAPDQEILPQATIRPPFVTIHHIRDFRYQSPAQFTAAWYDRTFDLRQLDSLWFVVEPFGQPGAAHTFMSFGFGDQYVAISVEIRKEKGESFSALAGLLRRYELMYVIGDERDLISLRANYRKDPVYLYRVHTTPEKMRVLFVSMVERANALRTRPEFYNTLTNTCTTNIVRHVNEIAEGRVPFSPAILLPSRSDRLAYDLGLLETPFTFEETRRRARINDKAAKAERSADFSRAIRAVD